MAKLIIRDEDEAATALAEALQSNLDRAIAQLEADDFFDRDHYIYTGYNLGTLICNPILANCLGAEVELLSNRFEKIYTRWSLGEEDAPDRFFFDYKVEEE